MYKCIYCGKRLAIDMDEAIKNKSISTICMAVPLTIEPNAVFNMEVMSTGTNQAEQFCIKNDKMLILSDLLPKAQSSSCIDSYFMTHCFYTVQGRAVCCYVTFDLQRINDKFETRDVHLSNKQLSAMADELGKGGPTCHGKRGALSFIVISECSCNKCKNLQCLQHMEKSDIVDTTR